MDKTRRKGDATVTRQAVMVVAVEDLLRKTAKRPLDPDLETRFRGRKPAGTEMRRLGFRLPQPLDVALYDLFTELNRPPRTTPQATLTRLAEIAVDDLLRSVDPTRPPTDLVERLRSVKGD